MSIDSFDANGADVGPPGPLASMMGAANRAVGSPATITTMAVAILLGIDGCVQADRERDTSRESVAVPVVRDSGGIEIVENPAGMIASSPVWQTDSIPTLAIGGINDTAPERLFDRLRAALRLADGRIVVADGGSNEIRMFDPEGHFITRWGRTGSGPGEFRTLQTVERWGTDSLIAWDRHLGRFSVFSRDGTLGRVFTYGDGMGISLAGVAAGGFLMATPPTHNLNAMRSGYTRELVQFEVVARDGSPRAVIGPVRGREMYVRRDLGGLSVSEVPYSRSAVGGAWGDFVVVGENDRYQLQLYSGDGALRRIVRLERPLNTPQASDIDAYLMHSFRYVSPDGRNRIREEHQRNPIPMPPSFPSFTDMVNDRTGRLWVRDHAMPGENVSTWTIFGPTGSVVASATVPGVEVLDVGEDYVLGKRTDDLGVESVVLFELRKTSGATSANVGER